LDSYIKGEITKVSANQYHLAQVNIARGLARITSPVMADFVAQLDTINALADRSPGFVWRLQDEAGNATSISVYEDPLRIVNLSVWESLETLYAFAYRSQHTEPFRDRRNWFSPLKTPHLALWWVPAGHIPTVEEAKQRLDLLAELGPTEKAFTFKSSFPPPSGEVNPPELVSNTFIEQQRS
jgi:hypothetical protein